MLTLFSYAPMIMMAPFINKMIKRFGKKEISVVGLLISTFTSFFLWMLRIQNPWIYITMGFFLNCGIGFLTLEVWVMATDVIDHQEWLTQRREEAANYAIFTFMRKIGQAIAALVPFLVGLAGYDSERVGLGQNPEALEGM